MAVRRSLFWFSLPLMSGLLLLGGRQHTADAQATSSQPGDRFELAEAVQIDQPSHAVQRQLERVKTLIGDRAWDEAIERLRQLSESPGHRLVGLGDGRYVELQEWCQRQLAALPAEARKVYRTRVDPVVRRWYERAIAERDRSRLRNVVDRAVASSYGLPALTALGEMTLESGDFTATRASWERAVALAADNPRELAAARARLVLVSILAGETARARAELAALGRSDPDARGRLGQREGRYVELLGNMLKESVAWRPVARKSDWTTFGGNAERNGVAPPVAILPGGVAWRLPIPDGSEHASMLPGLHPLLVGRWVLVNDAKRIFAVRAENGKAAWGQSAVVYQAESRGAGDPSEQTMADAPASPHYTMTARGDRLYARMGSSVMTPAGEAASGGGHLVCLDLAAEGRLLWKVRPDEGWALEGSPLADDQGVYLAMRRHDVRSQAAVACFDPGTGRLRWRRFVCAAETPGRGILAERTQNLLTMAGGTLYFNTNLGAVAALRAEDGRIDWLTLYPRALRGDLGELASHWRRTLNPCVLHRGSLLLAPADSPRIFCLDAASGAIRWQTGAEADDALDLLGATDDWLLAGGRRLLWIGVGPADGGQVKHVRPEGAASDGRGRGLLAGDCVVWPTRDKLYVFDQRTARLRQVCEWSGGGNVTVVDGRLLLAGQHEMVLLGVGPK